MDIPTVVRVLSLIGDGLFWRRVVDPAFDGRALVPATLQVLAGLLKPVVQAPPSQEIKPESEAGGRRTSGDRA
jgi:hypothetical protein